MRKDSEIEKYGKSRRLKYRKFFRLIEKYDYIAVFRHVKPDFDAVGSQMGLYTYLRDNYPNKHIVYVGENSEDLMPQCVPEVKYVDDSFFKEHDVLAIAVDTSQKKRISDERYKLCKYLVKIDHHPEVDRYGRLQIVDEELSAAGELVANILLNHKGGIITRECAFYLYMAIAGDSNRFLYDSVTPHTFEVSIELLKKGIVLSDLYRKMYEEDLSSLNVTRYVLDNFKVTPNGVAYYILDKDTLNKLGIKAKQGKNNINVFDHYKGIKIWCSFSEDVEEKVWRTSIRSAGLPIEKIALKYNGGGHAQASGAKPKNMKEVMELINELDEYAKGK